MADHVPPSNLPIGRGLRGRCPGCGQGRLFQGFLTLRPRCESCGLDFGFADAGDGPAIFVILIGGGIVGLEMAAVYEALGSKITVVELEQVA